MTDYFSLLQEARRPWLDPEVLKEKFFSLSAEAHPDRVHHAGQNHQRTAHERYTELNAAYRCLSEPKDRIRHLLELEYGEKPGNIDQIPQGTMDLFFEVSRLCREVDAFLAEKARNPSPLVKAQKFEQALTWTDQLQALLRKVQDQYNELLEELKSMNPAWESAPAEEGTSRLQSLPLKRLEKVYRQLSYLSRWTAQLQERIVQLSF